MRLNTAKPVNKATQPSSAISERIGIKALGHIVAGDGNQDMPIDYEGGDPKGYFGYKVLAVSFGGTLQLFGKKGATYANDTEFPNIDTKPWQSGRSWARLGASAAKGDPQVTLDRVVDWQPGDQFVVSTTDYLLGIPSSLRSNPTIHPAVTR